MTDPKNIERTALKITRWVGSPASIVVHTLVFAGSFGAVVTDIIDFDRMLLILTTVVSLEAIYLAIFIQMTINLQAADIAEVQEDVEEMTEDLGEIQEDVEELQEDIEEMSEDVEELSEEDQQAEQAEAARKAEQKDTLEHIEETLEKLILDITHLKQVNNSKDTKPLL
jgi:methyl-accepting chemotaxis protein